MAQRIDVPGMGIVEFPDGMPDDQISAAIRKNMPSQSVNNAQADPAMDVIKSAGTGLAKGGIGVLGLPGDIGSMVSGAAARAGVPEGARQLAGKVFSAHPLTRPFAAGPGSEDIQKKVESVTGEFYQPQTTAGRYTQAVGEFAPAAALPGGLATRAARAVLPGVGSEAAGQATEGTAAEPYARIAAALAGGSFANALGSGARVAAPAREALRSEAQSVYQNPRVTGAPVSPASLTTAADDIVKTMSTAGARPRNMPEVFAAVDELKALGARPTVADVRSVRESLSAIAQNKVVSAPKESKFANDAVRAIDKYLDGVSPQLRDANANYAASMRARTVDTARTKAERQANAANSGQNVDNATRQQFKSILNSDKRTRGFSPDELAQMERINQGTTTGNVARYIGNLLGGGGGMGQLVTAGLLGGGGYAAGGEKGALAGLGIAGLGRVGKGIGNASTGRQVSKLDEMVRSRSPLSVSQNVAAGQALTSAEKQALIAQMLMAASPVNQPNYQPR